VGETRARDFLSRFDSCSRLSVMEEIVVRGADALSQERLPRLLDIEGVAEHLESRNDT